MQHILIREKVKQQSIQKAEREGGGKNKAGKEASKKKGNIIEPDHIDYNKLNNELHRVAVRLHSTRIFRENKNLCCPFLTFFRAGVSCRCTTR